MTYQRSNSHLAWLPGLVCMLLAAAAMLITTTGTASAASQHHTHRQAVRHHKHHHRRVVVHIKAGGRGGDPGNDYPLVWRNAPQDSLLDNWRELNRECTSFAAWALYSRNGFTMPFNDNAINWGPRAQALGYAVNGTPAPGAIAWSNKPPLGHVAYVEGVDGGSVYIEEYNHYGNGTYDSRIVPVSTFTGYIHFKDIVTASGPASSGTSGTPLQGGSTPIQGGGSTPIQGSSPVLQGGSPPASGGGTTPPPPPTYYETTGGVTHTWTNYTNAGGSEGPSIPSNTTVQIACKLTGFAVADGNTWWYRVQSSPWSGSFYASADAFYNEPGVTSGSLVGTPWVDSSVPSC